MILSKLKSWFNYLIPAVIVIAVFAFLTLFYSDSPLIQNLLLQAWYIQALNTWLFIIGLLYWWQRQTQQNNENKTLVKFFVPDEIITREKAEQLVKPAPVEYRETLTVRRFQELLQGALYGEDIIRLNGELSRRDIAEIERGHLVLDSLKNIIPIVGFLGTVLGLSMGMVQFPEVSDIDAMRDALKGFAASLSIAFNTTLLALGYTILLVLLTAFLKEREESLVSQLDKDARKLIGKIQFNQETHSEEVQNNSDLQLAILKEIRDGINNLSSH